MDDCDNFVVGANDTLVRRRQRRQRNVFKILRLLPWGAGRGDGPVSRDLKVKVFDLTLLRSKNKGAYPLDRVMSSIDGSRVVRAHGTRTMPVWGEVFRQEHEKEKYTELTSLLKAKLIAEYVGTLQK